MTEFTQLHLLTAYPPANLNRDDTNRPKTAVMGGVPRLRISSQSLKRAIRTSDIFQQALEGHLGTRTKRLGGKILDHLKGTHPNLDESKALEVARTVAGRFGKLRSRPEVAARRAEIEQLAFVSEEEKAAAFALADRLAEGEQMDLDKESPLGNGHRAVDIAMFGRMLADAPQFNCEAAVQVAHAVTTHRVVIEDDYFTAVDDLKDVRDTGDEEEERGAGHVGEAYFGSGLFYLYICVNRDLLLSNLKGEDALARSALAALTEAAATVSPKGKQASFASHARAHYVLAERGEQQPRTLAGAFLKPVANGDYMAGSIKALEELRDRMDAAYGPCARERRVMNVQKGEGNLTDIVTFVSE